MAQINFLLLVCIASIGLTFKIVDAFDVIEYGAKGDGMHDDSQAFLEAWKAACGASGAIQTLNVPKGKTFFVSPLKFEGPCKPATIRVQIDGNLVAPSTKGGWKNCYGNTWIAFISVDGLAIQGLGTLDAKGSIWWDRHKFQAPLSGECTKPTTFLLGNCNNAVMMGLNFLNSGRNHISINGCENLRINNINITAPEDSHNTDGIDMADSRNVTILDSQIGTGDDCIALNNKCFNVNISGIACGPGHGISVGSLGKDGENTSVEGIRVEHCTFTGTMASARIKTFPGGSGYAKNIYYEHITLNNVQSAIEINQHYLNNPEQPKAVQVSDVHFIDVKGSGSKILLDCSQNVPCKEIYLEDVKIASSIIGKQVNVTCNHANVGAKMVTPPLSCTK